MSPKERINARLYYMGNWIVCVVGSILFLILTWYSFAYTQYMAPHGIEFPINIQDSKKQNLIVFAAACMVMVGLGKLEKILAPKVKKRIVVCVVLFMVLWLAAAGFWWICSAERTPGADCFYVCSDASSFMRGEYDSLMVGNYCDRYPRQLGLIAFLEVFFSIVGQNNYFAYEVLNAVLVPCIAYLGYRIVREITESMSAAVFYCLMMIGCLPLVFYTSWVYGEILGIFFLMPAFLLGLRYSKRKWWGYLAGTVFSLAMAMLIRSNAIILMIAFSIAALLCAIRQKDKKMLLLAVCAIIVPQLTFSGIQWMYEMRSGVEKSSGLPGTAGISVGLQEKDGRYGWDWLHEGSVYDEVGHDKERADIVFRQEIRERLQTFMEQPSYALFFFREKQLSQWNEPLYQSYYFSQNYSPDAPPNENSLIYRLGEMEYFIWILRICDRLQFVLYAGMLFYFLFAVKKDSNIMEHIFPIMIIGGFFFSLIWEAKARYILPYYIGMYPMAAIGYQQFIVWLKGRIATIRKNAAISRAKSEKERTEADAAYKIQEKEQRKLGFP